MRKFLNSLWNSLIMGATMVESAFSAGNEACGILEDEAKALREDMRQERVARLTAE